MIHLDEARKILLDAVSPRPVAEVPLWVARERVLAIDVAADRDFPPTDRSAMDGYALRAADAAEAGSVLKLGGEVRAGQAVGETRVEPGHAVRIFTGAIVPPGADTVVMVEHTEEAEGGVRFVHAVEPKRNIRYQGEDRPAGAPVLAAGTPVGAAQIAALASVGCTTVPVHHAPRVAVLSTGDEIVDPSETPADHQVRNSNAAALVAQLGEMGLDGHYLGVAPDEPEGLGEALREGLSHDVLLITGGVSVGKYDLVGQALEHAGTEVLFHKVAMKPGKPVLAGRCGPCLVMGLPGNPVSTFTGFLTLVRPALRKMLGHPDPFVGEIEAVLDAPLKARGPRITFHLAQLRQGVDGWHASPVTNASSGDVLSLSGANGYVITPVDSAGAEAGERLPGLLWSPPAS